VCAYAIPPTSPVRETVMVVADAFWDGLPGILVVTFICGGWVIVAVVNTAAKSWRKVRESEHLAGLKQSMIEKGMSVEDIERVVRASPEPEPEPQPKAEKVEYSPLVNLATKLVEQEVPANVMEEILMAYRDADPAGQRILAKVVEELFDNGADGERVLVVVRTLGRPARPQDAPRLDPRFSDPAGSFRG